jgi:hypothetical protein
MTKPPRFHIIALKQGWRVWDRKAQLSVKVFRKHSERDAAEEFAFKLNNSTSKEAQDWLKMLEPDSLPYDQRTTR